VCTARRSARHFRRRRYLTQHTSANRNAVCRSRVASCLSLCQERKLYGRSSTGDITDRDPSSPRTPVTSTSPVFDFNRADSGLPCESDAHRTERTADQSESAQYPTASRGSHPWPGAVTTVPRDPSTPRPNPDRGNGNLLPSATTYMYHRGHLHRARPGGPQRPKNARRPVSRRRALSTHEFCHARLRHAKKGGHRQAITLRPWRRVGRGRCRSSHEMGVAWRRRG
jgi:hypothetical protein